MVDNDSVSVLQNRNQTVIWIRDTLLSFFRLIKVSIFCIGPGRYKALTAAISSMLSGPNLRSTLCIPADSNWKILRSHLFETSAMLLDHQEEPPLGNNLLADSFNAFQGIINDR